MKLSALLASEVAIVRRLIRYTGVSVLTAIMTLGVLIAGIQVFGMSHAAANLMAVSFGAVPNYILNRSWVWNKSGKSHLWREIVPFWTYTVIGAVLSTAVVAWADGQWEGSIPAAIAQLTTYGVLWVAKFVFLDKLLFGATVVEDDEAMLHSAGGPTADNA